MVAALRTPPRLTVRIDSDRSLHDLLAGSWLLVTGWSNSVLEAAIARAPSIAVDPERRSPVRYADEGLALPATDSRSAAEAAATLLDPAVRDAAIARGREALEDHIGPLDGRASARAAALIRQMARPR